MALTLPNPDHAMRPECAKEFGKLEAQARENELFRISVKDDLAQLKTETSEIKQMLAGHIAGGGLSGDRLDKLEIGQEKIQDRIYSLGVKIGMVIAVVQLIVQIVIANYGGG